MDKSIIERVNNLRTEIEQHNHNYYVMDNPTVDDYTYDMLMQELKNLEAEYPELADPNSPTQRVGGEALNLFEKVEHKVQMGSLQDVFSLEQVQAFTDRCREASPKPGKTFTKKHLMVLIMVIEFICKIYLEKR